MLNNPTCTKDTGDETDLPQTLSLRRGSSPRPRDGLQDSVNFTDCLCPSFAVDNFHDALDGFKGPNSLVQQRKSEVVDVQQRDTTVLSRSQSVTRSACLSCDSTVRADDDGRTEDQRKEDATLLLQAIYRGNEARSRVQSMRTRASTCGSFLQGETLCSRECTLKSETVAESEMFVLPAALENGIITYDESVDITTLTAPQEIWRCAQCGKLNRVRCLQCNHCGSSIRSNQTFETEFSRSQELAKELVVWETQSGGPLPLSGHLLKKSPSAFHGWQRRFFMLEEGRLLWWHSQRDAEKHRDAGCKGVVDFHSCSCAVRQRKEATKFDLMPLGGSWGKHSKITGAHAGRVLEIDAKGSEHDLTQWLDAISEHMSWSQTNREVKTSPII